LDPSTVAGLTNEQRKEDIVIFQKYGGVAYGGGDGYPLFQSLRIQPVIKKNCNERYECLAKPYLCIQIRNKDYKCNYEELYENHKDEIHLAKQIYVATDDKSAIDFFRSKELPIQNFTTFPEKYYYSLHTSIMNPMTKMTDLLADIYIIGR